MANISNYLELALLDHSVGTASYTAPVAVHLALFTSAPGDDDSGTEVSGGSYTRKVVTFSAASTDGSGDSTAVSAADVEFDEATASWGTVTHVGIYDQATGGNLLWHGAVTTSKTVGSGDTVIIRASDLVLGLD